MEKLKGEALGFVETKGMVPAIQAADVMLKAADVELISYENVGSSLVTVIIAGDVSAIRTAVNLGVAAASAIGEVTSYHVIPRPVQPVNKIVNLYKIDNEQGA